MPQAPSPPEQPAALERQPTPEPADPHDEQEPSWDWSANRGRWLRGMVIALLTAAAVGSLLGYLAMLPFFLGLFFFLLLGLIPGAVLVRYGDPIRPVPSRHLWIASLLLFACTWCVACYVEYHSLAGHVAVKVRRSIASGFPKGYRREVLDDHIAGMVRDILREGYGSSGLMGYVKWAARSGRIRIPAGTIRLSRKGNDADGPPVVLVLKDPVVYRLPQPALLWCIRVVMSFGLLILAFFLQVTALRRPQMVESAEEDEAEGEGTPDIEAASEENQAQSARDGDA